MCIRDSSATRLAKLKQLLQDDTELIEDDDTGALLGLRNGAVELDITKSLVVAFDVEGTNWKGQSTLENAEGPYDTGAVSYTHLRAHETVLDLVCRLLLEKKKNTRTAATIYYTQICTSESKFVYKSRYRNT